MFDTSLKLSQPQTMARIQRTAKLVQQGRGHGHTHTHREMLLKLQREFQNTAKGDVKQLFKDRTGLAKAPCPNLSVPLDTGPRFTLGEISSLKFQNVTVGYTPHTAHLTCSQSQSMRASAGKLQKS